MTAACSQFTIRKEDTVKMTLSGPSKYTYLKLSTEQSQAINSLAKEVGVNHEKGPGRNTFMVYKGNFYPNQVKAVDSTCEATLEEKRIFGQIFEIASASINTQMGWSVSPDDVKSITLEKTVDFSFKETQRACELSVELSQSAADRLGLKNDSRFHEYYKGSPRNIMRIVHPGEI